MDVTDAQTDSPKAECLQHGSNGARHTKKFFSSHNVFPMFL